MLPRCLQLFWAFRVLLSTCPHTTAVRDHVPADALVEEDYGCPSTCNHVKSEKLYGFPAGFRHYYASENFGLPHPGVKYVAKILPCSQGKPLSNTNVELGSGLAGSSQFQIQVDEFTWIEELDDERIGVCRMRDQPHDGEVEACICKLAVPDLVQPPGDWQAKLKSYFFYPLVCFLLVVLLVAHYLRDPAARQCRVQSKKMRVKSEDGNFKTFLTGDGQRVAGPQACGPATVLLRIFMKSLASDRRLLLDGTLTGAQFEKRMESAVSGQKEFFKAYNNTHDLLREHGMYVQKPFRAAWLDFLSSCYQLATDMVSGRIVIPSEFEKEAHIIVDMRTFPPRSFLDALLQADDGYGVLKFVTDDIRAPPVADIEKTWFVVLVDSMLALCCDVPFLGFFPLVYMFGRYSLTRTHLLFDAIRKGRAFAGFLCNRAFLEATVWAVLFFRCISTAVTYVRRYERLTRADTQGPDSTDAVMKQILHETEVGVLVGSCVLGATLLWRVLSVHQLRLQAQAYCHKELAEEKFDDRAKSILDGLKAAYPEHFSSSPAPRSVVRMATPSMSLRNRIITLASTLVLASGLVGLQLGFSWVDAKPEWVPSYLWWRRQLRSVTGMKLARTVFVCCVIAVPTFQASVYWWKLIAGILRICESFKRHAKQLMLFTFLTSTSEQVEMWGDDGQSFLEEMRQYMSAQAKKFPHPSQGPGPEEDLQDILYNTLSVAGEQKLEKLDFTQRADIMAWWHVRRWVQVDFLDESAAMECAGTAVVLLLANLAFAGFMEWIHKDKDLKQTAAAPGMWLILVLSLVLIFLLYDVLQACITINAFLERDSRLLLDAEMAQLKEVGKTGKTDISKTEAFLECNTSVALLHAVQRNVEAFESKQSLFGITVTANVRNGWMLSLVFLFLNSAWSLVGTELMSLDSGKLAALVMGSNVTTPAGNYT